MTYVSPPPGNRLGIYADKIEEIREQKSLTASGFREDGTDAAGAEKESMLRKLYRRADTHLPPGLGGPPTVDDPEES